MVKAENGAKIEYRFDSARAGYAEGTIAFTAEKAGAYSLYWADDSAALADWFPIAEMMLKAGESGGFTFKEQTAIPAGAKKLIAVQKDADPTVHNAAAVYEIPAEKRFPYAAGEKRYRFGALSDIHIDVQDGGKNVYYTNASKNFALALEVCHSRKADFILCAGDQVTNASGATAEWLEYQRILAASSYDKPVYEAIGNHEMRFAKYVPCDVDCGIEDFIISTGLDGTAETMDARKPYYEVTEPSTGDHFIFMALEKHADPNEHDEFSDEQMAWVEGLLKKYTGDGHKIFLIQHSSIYGYGAGDDPDDPAYDGSLNTEFPNNARFKQLVETYKDVIWFSGHTHLDLADDCNYSDESGTACHMFHIPSTAGTTRLTYNDEGKSEMDRTFYDDATQGYLTDVYDGASLVCGVNFFHNKFYPAYSYIIGDTPEAQPPTQPTEKPSEKPTEKPTEKSTEAATNAPFVWGDANENGELDILDATVIQRTLASLPVSAYNEKVSDVDGDGEVTILDATAIQRKLAGLIKRFPVEQQIAPTGASNALTTAKSELTAYYQYASYPAYAALKRAYNAADTSAAQAALTDFRALRKRVKLTTVYFTDELYLNNVYAYVWNSATGEEIEAWPGQKMTYIKNNSYGYSVFAVTVDTARYDSIVFNNARKKKTVDIPLTDQSGRVYYPISKDIPYQTACSVYEKNWYYDSDETATVYFTDTEDWGKVNIYAWTTGTPSWPGTAMTFVRKSSAGKSIYKASVPKNAKVIFNNGTEQTVDIPAVADGFGYYPYQKNDDGKWQVVEYKY